MYNIYIYRERERERPGRNCRTSVCVARLRLGVAVAVLGGEDLEASPRYMRKQSVVAVMIPARLPTNEYCVESRWWRQALGKAGAEVVQLRVLLALLLLLPLLLLPLPLLLAAGLASAATGGGHPAVASACDTARSTCKDSSIFPSVVRPPIRLSSCPPVCLSARLPACLPVCLFVL